VLLDVRYCGICGSDLHMLGMPAEMIPAGHVLGHEFTGVVADLGPGVDGWDAGERVTVLPMVSCGECYACRTGHLNLCEKGINHGPGIGRQGAYAESVVVPAGMLRRLPAAVSDADGALVEPLAVAIRAIRLSGATPQEPVCVLGAGPIGVLTVAGLRARGFGQVAVVEPTAGRRAAATGSATDRNFLTTHSVHGFGKPAGAPESESLALLRSVTGTRPRIPRRFPVSCCRASGPLAAGDLRGPGGPCAAVTAGRAR
jgi:threonine dehydrogenase-like Zn-dependent dehydrogenase